MKKEVLFFLLPPFADWEPAYLASYLGWDGESNPHAVKTVSLTREPIKSIGKFTILPDYALHEIPEDYAALILIGGMSWRKPVADPVIALVKKTLDKGILVGAICDAATFLAKNGFLNTVKHTGNHVGNIQEYAGEAYTNAANFQFEPAVLDGNIITADGESPLEFARLVLETLKHDTQEDIDAWYDESVNHIENKKKQGSEAKA